MHMEQFKLCIFKHDTKEDHMALKHNKRACNNLLPQCNMIMHTSLTSYKNARIFTVLSTCFKLFIARIRPERNFNLKKLNL